MSTQHDDNEADQDETELVGLDLGVAPNSQSPLVPESFFDKLQRCGNAPDSTPLPWAQLSVVMLVSLSEGSSPQMLWFLFAVFALQCPITDY